MGELAPGSVHVWRVPLDGRADLAERKSLLSTDEAERAARFRFDDDRRKFIVGRGTLRRLLGRYLDVAPKAIEFAYSPHGKPLLGGALAGRALHFNLSNSGELAIVGLSSDRPLGVDVERIRQNLDVDGLAGRYFSPSECDTLRALPQGDRYHAFFTFWTKKEAVIKAHGHGLSLPLDRFSVSLDPEDLRVECDADLPHDLSRWSVSELPVPAGYYAALALEGLAPAICVYDWE